MVVRRLLLFLLRVLRYIDAAGNAASTTQSNNTASLTEKVLPTIALSSSAANLKAGETATITFTISESVSDFVIGDITVSGGTLGSFVAVSGTSYTVVFTLRPVVQLMA